MLWQRAIVGTKNDVQIALRFVVCVSHLKIKSVLGEVKWELFYEQWSA